MFSPSRTWRDEPGTVRAECLGWGLCSFTCEVGTVHGRLKALREVPSPFKFTQLGLSPWNSPPGCLLATPSLFPHTALPLGALKLQCLCRLQHYLGL